MNFNSIKDLAKHGITIVYNGAKRTNPTKDIKENNKKVEELLTKIKSIKKYDNQVQPGERSGK